MESGSHFIGRVESLRGLAALVVAVFHSLRWFPVGGHEAVYAMPFSEIDGTHVGLARAIAILFNGNAAVSLFFVISGLVLGLSIERSGRSWPELTVAFTARRVLRLYPPMAINLLIVFAAACLAAAAAPGLYQGVPISDLVQNLSYQEPALVSATWSLFIEMGIVPFFLVAMLIARQLGGVAFVALVMLGVVSLFSDYGVPSWWETWRIGNFFLMFILGAAAPLVGPVMTAAIPRGLAGPVLGLSVVFLGAARGVFGWGSPWALLFEAVAAFLVVSIVTWAPPSAVMRWLEHHIARTLGRISYSFYLYHPLLMLLVTPPALIAAEQTGLSSKWPLLSGFILAAVTIPPSLVLARYSYWLVEVPCMRAGVTVSHLLSAAWPARSWEGGPSPRS